MFNINDIVTVTTDRLSPWLGRGATARIAGVTENSYIIDFQGLPDSDGSDDERSYILFHAEVA